MSNRLPNDFPDKVRLGLKRQLEQLDRSPNKDEKAEDEATAIAQDDYEDLQRRKAETAGIVERNQDRRANRKLRASYARLVFCYLVWYSICWNFIANQRFSAFWIHFTRKSSFIYCWQYRSGSYWIGVFCNEWSFSRLEK